MPESVADAGCLFCVKLTGYYAGNTESVSDRVVYAMKRSSDVNLYDWLAKRLEENARRSIEEGMRYSGADSAFITYVPRSRKAVARYGHDQARCLAVALSKRLGIPCVRLAERTRSSHKEMKKLGRDDRFAQSASAYRQARRLPSLENSVAVIVDDVVTSGASVFHVSRLLRGLKTCGFGVISVGISQSKDTKKPSEESNNE